MRIHIPAFISLLSPSLTFLSQAFIHPYNGAGKPTSLAKYISLEYLEVRRAGGENHLVRLAALAVTRDGHVSKRLMDDINLV